MADTGYKNPSATGSPDNSWTNPANAYAEDGVFAVDDHALGAINQSYRNFTFGIPSDAKIDGIEVRIKLKVSSGTGSMGVKVESDVGPRMTNGTSSSKFMAGIITTTNTAFVLGGPTDLWGTTWEPEDFTNTNFVITPGVSSGALDYSVDVIQVKVYYTAATAPATKTIPKAPGTATVETNTDGLHDGNWTSPNNIKVSDGASANGNTSNGGQSTAFLFGSNFGFAIPANSVINGIEAQVLKAGTPTGDLAVYLMKTLGSVVGSNKASATLWNFDGAESKYGGPTDLWGTTWTPAEINASGFGLAFSAYNQHGGGSATVQHMRIVVYYTPPQPPLQPSALAPAGGIAVETLTPRLSWTYNPGQVGDTQSAFRVVVTRQSDSVVMVDTGKVTSVNNYYDVLGGAGLAFGVAYQWKVLTYSLADVIGPYSGTVVFRTSQKPTVAISYPADAGTATSDTPLVAWAYSDPESTPQTRYRVEILNSAGSSVLYDSGFITSPLTSHQIPVGILINGGSYKARVTVTDTDGLDSTPDVNSFTVTFVSPPTPSISGAVDSQSNVQLTIGLNAPADDAWGVDYMKLYKKNLNDADYTLLEPNFPIVQRTIDLAESTFGWTQSGTGTAPIVSAAKQGDQSLGMGRSGTGTATYTKSISQPNYSIYEQIQAWLFATDVTKFTSVRIKFGLDSSNYYYYDVLASNMTNGVWEMAAKDFSALSIVGTPSQVVLTYFAIDIVGGTGAVTAGNVRIDQIRFLKKNYTYTDYNVATGNGYKYALSTYNEDETLESARAFTADLAVAFAEELINTYLVPVDDPSQLLKGWMDGAKVPSWTDKTETKYYSTRGSQKPSVLVNGVQKYKEGSIELRFFDALFGGDGLLGVDALEDIKNFKPILLKTWWGRNYYISIDGEVSTQRKPGIGWFSSFTFTEIA